MPNLTQFDLSGRVAAVTGGNGGIGKGIALALAEAGAAVAILARNEAKNRAALSELHDRKADAIAIQLDVNQRAALQGAARSDWAQARPTRPKFPA